MKTPGETSPRPTFPLKQKSLSGRWRNLEQRINQDLFFGYSNLEHVCTGEIIALFRQSAWDPDGRRAHRGTSHPHKSTRWGTNPRTTDSSFIGISCRLCQPGKTTACWTFNSNQQGCKPEPELGSTVYWNHHAAVAKVIRPHDICVCPIIY